MAVVYGDTVSGATGNGLLPSGFEGNGGKTIRYRGHAGLGGYFLPLAQPGWRANASLRSNGAGDGFGCLYLPRSSAATRVKALPTYRCIRK